MSYTAYFDGSSNGKIGAISYVILDEQGEVILQCGKKIKRTESNISEYKALLSLLREVRKQGLTDVQIYGDNRGLIHHVVSRMAGGPSNDDNKNQRLSALLCDSICYNLRLLDGCTLSWTRRENNKLADSLAAETSGLRKRKPRVKTGTKMVDYLNQDRPLTHRITFQDFLGTKTPI